MTTPRILVAENKSLYRTRIVSLLEEQGWRCDQARTPAEARTYLRSDSVDVALLDLRLDNDDDEYDISGFHLAKEFDERRIPTILMTGAKVSSHASVALKGLPSTVATVHKVSDDLLKHEVSRAYRPRVFLVRGRDRDMTRVARLYLDTFKIRLTDLSDVSPQGRTLMEMLEDHGNVTLAVVLLSPDDEGRLVNVGETGSDARMEPRARQNVVLELGYFLGRLGREKVVILSEGEVTLPSDLDGVKRTEVGPDGKWQDRLGEELRRVGIRPL
jgi:predicted nucleotide-binding protein